jgi:hypothetical protein
MSVMAMFPQLSYRGTLCILASPHTARLSGVPVLDLKRYSIRFRSGDLISAVDEGTWDDVSVTAARVLACTVSR